MSLGVDFYIRKDKSRRQGDGWGKGSGSSIRDGWRIGDGGSVRLAGCGGGRWCGSDGGGDGGGG